MILDAKILDGMAPEPVRRPWKSDPTITLQFFVSWIMEIVVSQLAAGSWAFSH